MLANATEPNEEAVNEASSTNEDKTLLKKTVDASKKTIKNISEKTTGAADAVLIKPATKVADKTKTVIKSVGEESKKIGKQVKKAIVSSDGSRPTLITNINGVEKELLDNINAYLQRLPTNNVERSAYLFTFEEKVQSAMHALGYYQGTVTPVLERNEEPWVLTLTIDSGKPMRYRKVSIVVEGQAKTDEAFNERLDNIGIHVGDVVNHQTYETLKTDLVSLGLIRGYFDGNMIKQQLKVDRADNEAELTLLYDSKQRYVFGDVEFTGSDLEPQLLQSMVSFDDNQPYHNDALSSFTSTLLSVGYFDDVKVLPQPQRNNDGLVPIRVELAPAPKYQWELGAGYATDTEGRVSVTLRTPKINSRGHSQETRLEISKVNPELSFEYRIPLSHPRDDVFQIGTSFGRKDFGDLESVLLQGSLSRTTVIKNSWTRRYFVRYLNEQWDQLDSSYNADYILPGVSFSKTRREGPPLDPTDGFRQVYTVEYGTPIDSDAEKTGRLQAKLRWVKTPYAGHRISTRLDVGINTVTDEKAQELAPSLRFFAGGDQTIRGYKYQSVAPTVEDNGIEQVVGGRYLGAASVEYQYYLNHKWRIATFFDGGNAFDERNSKEIDWKASYGLGVHWISPIGPIRVDVGYGFTEDDAPIRLHIGIGAEL